MQRICSDKGKVVVCYTGYKMKAFNGSLVGFLGGRSYSILKVVLNRWLQHGEVQSAEGSKRRFSRMRDIGIGCGSASGHFGRYYYVRANWSEYLHM